MSASAPLALVDGRRQIVVIDEAEHAHALTAHRTSCGELGPARRNRRALVARVVSRRLPAGRLPHRQDGQNSRVWVTDVRGVRAAEVASMGERVPIYLQWALDGSRLAVLSQDSRELVLQVADPIGESTDRELLRGTPLFFTWVDGGRVAAFVGEGEPTKPRMAIITPGRARHELVGTPGNFCAPVRTHRGIAYVAHVRRQVTVLVSSLDGARVRELESVEGLVALLANRTGQQLARAISPDGTGTPYRALEILDIDTADATAVTDRPCVAFFWLPDGSGMLLACSEEGKAEVEWWRVGWDGTEESLFTLTPSRDSRVYLRFFEQYGPSHPILSPDGRYLVVCGTLPGATDTPSRAYRVPLDGSPPEELGEGLFASFAPRRATPPSGTGA